MASEQEPRYIEAEGDKPKLKPTRDFFRELRASLKNGLDVERDMRAENESLRADLLAAQERTQLLGRTTQNLHAELQAAQEREKALREAFREYADELTGQVREEILAILAASPSEKPE